MQRGSDKHSARLDDALEQEVSGLMRSGHDNREDWNSPEPSGEDQPDVDLVPNGTLSGGVPEGMTGEDVDGRSELASYLGRAWPATREDLIGKATENDAPDSVLQQLQGLPEGSDYENMQELWSALSGGHVESNRF